MTPFSGLAVFCSGSGCEGFLIADTSSEAAMTTDRLAPLFDEWHRRLNAMTIIRLPLSVRETLRVARHYAVAKHGTPLAIVDEADRWIRAGVHPSPQCIELFARFARMNPLVTDPQMLANAFAAYCESELSAHLI